MSDIEKKLAFLLATSPHLDTVNGLYDEAAMDLVAMALLHGNKVVINANW